MTHHPRYESMLRATSAQAPLHDDLPPFVDLPPVQDRKLYPGCPNVCSCPRCVPDKPYFSAQQEADDPPLSWSYERATD